EAGRLHPLRRPPGRRGRLPVDHRSRRHGAESGRQAREVADRPPGLEATSVTADVNGTTLYYEQEGAGRDLVLIPGLGASVHAWYSQLRGLPPVLRVTAMDPRGHGRSAAPPGPYSMRLLADDAAGLIRHLGLAPALVAGSSMSAMVAIELAAAHPDL